MEQIFWMGPISLAAFFAWQAEEEFQVSVDFYIDLCRRRGEDPNVPEKSSR